MLHRGQRFTFGGVGYRVQHVNPSRAHCVATTARMVSIRDPTTGAIRQFMAQSARSLDISANAAVDVLQEYEARR